MEEIIRELMTNEWELFAVVGGLLFVIQLLTFQIIRIQRKTLEKQLYETDRELEELKIQQKKLAEELGQLKGVHTMTEEGEASGNIAEKAALSEKSAEKGEASGTTAGERNALGENAGNAQKELQEQPEQLIEAVLAEVFQN